jgi:hypothetical protein
MLSLTKLSTLARSLQRPMCATFSSDGWKKRDEAAEKVFVSQQESKYQLNKDSLLKIC